MSKIHIVFYTLLLGSCARISDTTANNVSIGSSDKSRHYSSTTINNNIRIEDKRISNEETIINDISQQLIILEKDSTHSPKREQEILKLKNEKKDLESKLQHWKEGKGTMQNITKGK